MSLKVSRCLPAIGLLLLVQPQLKAQQSMCAPVSNNPLVMENLCNDAPRVQALPAKQMSATATAQSVLALTVEEINHARLHDAPPIRMGDLLLFEANRKDFIFEIQLSNGSRLVLGPWTQTEAKDTVATWGKVRGRLDYPETLGQSIVSMKITPVHPGGSPPLLRGIKIDRLGEYVFELERVRPAAAPRTEAPMSYPQDPRVMPASITRPNPFRPEPQTGFLAPGLPALFLRPMMFQSSGLACAPSEGSSTENIVKPCQIEVPHNLQDASFTLVYRFETTRHGKLFHITKVRNDFLPDAPFHACMAQWKLPSIPGHGVAEFTRTPTEGWKEIHISGKGFDQTFPYH